MTEERKTMRVHSADVTDGKVALWIVPDWLKGDRVFPAFLTPEQARGLAIKLLQAAEAMT